MTEEEAKTKWCCGPKLIADQIYAMQRIHYERERGAQHEPLPPNKNGTCVGSKCMAWREHLLSNGNPAGIGGYCGLAVTP